MGVGKVETGKFLNGSIQARDRGHSVMLRVSGEGKQKAETVLGHHEIKQPRLEAELMGLTFLFFKMGIGMYLPLRLAEKIT